MRGAHALAFTGCVAVWSTTWLAIRASTAASPVGAAALRATLATLVLALVAIRLAPRQPSWRQAWRAQGAGAVFIGANFALVYAAAGEVPTHVAALLYATLPLQTALLGPLLSSDRVEPRAIVGALLGAAGTGVAFQSLRGVQATQLAGALLVLLGATASAAGSALARRSRDLHPLWLNVHANAAGAVVLWLLWMAADRRPPLPTAPLGWLAMAYMVLVGSVAAFLLYFWLLRRWSAARASYASLLASLGATLLGIALGEPWAWPTLAGGALVVAGAWLALRQPAAKVRQAPGATAAE